MSICVLDLEALDDSQARKMLDNIIWVRGLHMTYCLLCGIDYPNHTDRCPVVTAYKEATS